MKRILFLFLIFTPLLSFSQPLLYPSNWWVGMKHNKVQILARSTDNEFNKSSVTVNYAGVVLEKVTPMESGKYIVLDIAISNDAKPGMVVFEFTKGKKTQKVNWNLKARGSNRPGKGVTSEDFIYLVMPDRFSNGDPTNDKLAGARDQTLNRDSIFHRHGGDIQGIINHLDYLQDLGVTAVWMMPVFENNMPNRSEHGYAITDHYVVEPRLGNNQLYKKLGEEIHKRNMKLIQDAVYNHVGLYHFFVQDKPTKDWLHEWPSYTGTTYKDQPLIDNYGSKADRTRMSDGWFTPMMPDLNQSNPYVANFLIQHAIWSVEEFGVDGWRVDTYIYNDLGFMNRCNQALYDEYPAISIFGETWIHGVPSQAYFVKNNIENLPFKSNLNGITDFQTNMYGIGYAVNEPFGWTNGVNRLYTTLAFDFLYENPMNNVNFLDNHDMSRFYSVVGEDVNKQKMGIAWLLTCRGIPQMYYGTEILMKGFSNPDGWVRLDFPGGWAGDKANKFTAAGRTEKENETFEWTKKLARFRLTSSAIKTGKMMQFVPENGIYVYFRYDENQTVMCIMNSNDKEMTLDPARFSERIKSFTQGIEVTTGKTIPLNGKLTLPPRYVQILELK